MLRRDETIAKDRVTGGRDRQAAGEGEPKGRRGRWPPSAVSVAGTMTFLLFLVWASTGGAALTTITITSPANGATITTPTLTLAGTSTNATRIQICIDATNCQDATGVASWSATVDISGLSAGPHNITACAYPVTGSPNCALIVLTVSQSTTIIQVPVFVNTVDSSLHTYVVPGLAIGGVAATAVVALRPGSYRVGQGVVGALTAALLVELGIRLLASPISWSYAILTGLLLATGAVNLWWRPKATGGRP